MVTASPAPALPTHGIPIVAITSVSNPAGMGWKPLSWVRWL